MARLAFISPGGWIDVIHSFMAANVSTAQLWGTV